MYLEGRAKPNLMGYKETRPKIPELNKILLKNEDNSVMRLGTLTFLFDPGPCGCDS